MANDNSVVVKVGDKVFIKGDQGAVFVPELDDTGILSWTNDGGLPNPAPRNIQGKSAYDLAVEGGYPGTEEEFNADLALFKPLSEAAVAAKDDAVAAKERAVTAEASAEASATSASGSASSASTSADNASASASQAASSAGTATTAAATATTKANAAAASANDAGGYATSAGAASSAAISAKEDAVSAKTSAQASASFAADSASSASTSATSASSSASTATSAATAATAAQTAAESAQAAAESAAESIEESAAQIAQNTADIAELDTEVTQQKSVIGQEQKDNEVTTSYNKWNPAEETRNANISNSSATLGEVISGNYNVSGLIPASKGNKISYYYSNNPATGNPPSIMAIAVSAFRIAEYGKDGACILVTSNWARLPYEVQSDGAYWIRFVSGSQYNWNMLTVNDGDIRQKPFVAYKPNFNLSTDNAVRITELESDLTYLENPAEVIVPSHIYGVNGQQINVYKENLVLYNRLKSLAYIHTKIPDSWQNDERTIWTPTASALAENSVDFEVFKYGTAVASEKKQIIACSVPKDTGSSSIKVLILGDSKVANGYVSYHFLHNFDDDNMTCTLLGTQYDWQEDNRNEGYGSRTAKWFCTNSASPFCNNGVFDFANYLSANAIETPDYVFINLGTNDCASLAGSNTTFLTEFVTYIEQMISSIHAVSPNIVVCIGMCEGCATVHDTNNSDFLIWDLNQKISRLHKVTIESFDNRQAENIYVCPMYMGMDLTQDYNMTEVPLSQRDADVNNGQGNGKTRMQITDRVHQSEVGYWKNADYMYALVKYIVAKSLA